LKQGTSHMNGNIPLATELRSRFDELPEELTEVILDPLLNVELEDIAKRYGLSEQQKKVLSNEVMLVLFLFEPLSQLRSTLVQNMEISPSTAEAIMFELEAGALYGVTVLLSAIESTSDFIGTRQGKAVLPTANTAIPDKLHLRPESVEQKQVAPAPLRKEDVMQYVTAQRTMATDVAEAQKAGGPVATPTAPQQTSAASNNVQKQSPAPIPLPQRPLGK
jgi:hypothetical protein